MRGLLAEPLLRGANRFNAEHRADQSAHVEDLARVLPFRRALALVVDVLLEILAQLEPTGGVLQGGRVVADGAGLGPAARAAEPDVTDLFVDYC